jgi:molybdenum cofactor cytidylyltransferase
MQHVVDEVIVVTGHYHDDIVPIVTPLDHVKIVYNKNYDDGMFSSIKTGLRSVDGDVFIVPGDCPLICKDVYTLLLDNEGEIRVPTYHGRKGHPLFLEKHLIAQLLAFDDYSNLKVFRDQQDVHYYATNCQGILKDIDTLKAYEKIVERNDSNENQ